MNATIDTAALNKSQLVCYAPTMISMGGIWKGENPLDFSFPLFLLQLLLIVLTTRATAIILQPLQQPRYLAEIIGGLMLGPNVMGRIPDFADTIFPLRSVIILETMANLGLIYFMFIVGVELDPTAVHRSNRSTSFAAVCIGVPFLIGTFTTIVIQPDMDDVNQIAFLIFLCVTLSITAFTVLARTLAELKLLNTSLGTTALSSAMLVDSFVWVLLALAITLAQNEGELTATVYTLLSGMVFYAAMRTVVKPAIDWVVDQTPEGDEVDDLYACILLVGVLVLAFISDAIGIHAITGAFIFGLLIPNGSLGEALVERIEDFVEGLLLPLFFATSGLKMNLNSISSSDASLYIFLLMVMGTGAKITGCVLVGHLYGMNIRDGIAMGLLMNTKGVIEMVLLNIGRDRLLLSESTFSMLVCLSVIITAVSTPLLRYTIRPSRRWSTYTRRTVAWANPDSQLRLVLCIHSTRHVPSSISLLDAINPCKRAPISAYALHLVELTSRASAMIIVNTATAASKDPHSSSGSTNLSSSFSSSSTNSRSMSEHIMHALEVYERHTAGVAVQLLTAVSAYSTMHKDVASIAEDNHAAFIVLPFHKQQTVDGSMEPTNPALRTFNQMVLASAPCSVGLLVDRGLRTAARFAGGSAGKHHVTVLFFGGADDREAVAIAGRMAEHPGVSLTALRFVLAEDSPKSQRVVNVNYEDEDHERQKDEDCVNEFRQRFLNHKSTTFVERVVGNAEETVEVIRESLEYTKDLYVVGINEAGSPLTAGLTDWSECPELGVIGDLLVSADFGAKLSVLVVQQSKERLDKKLSSMKKKERMKNDEGKYDT